MSSIAPAPCRSHLSLGITGHRGTNPSLRDNLAQVVASLEALFTRIDAMLEKRARALGPVRMHSLLVDGVDQIAAELAVARGWELVAPLPFGAEVNLAINARPSTREDATALCHGEAASDPEVEARAQAIRAVTARARLFELADRDETVRALFEAMLADPGNLDKARAFDAECSDRVDLAGRVMIERTDLIVAVWDGKVSNLRGGTGHTVVAALELGTPVLLIDPANPSVWAIYTRPEELAGPVRHDESRLAATIEATFLEGDADETAMHREKWHARSSHTGTLYRRIEAVFGGEGRPFRKLATAYEGPEQIEDGSGKELLSATSELLTEDVEIARYLRGVILPQFAWADGVSSRLSDAYRSGMCYNFFLSAAAVIIGAAYLPLGLGEHKWIFASAELLLLGMILLITFAGRRMGLHTRWFETRRVAEYLRHSPGLLLLGVARPTGRWPRGKEKEWPEHFARHSLREAGLPRIRLDRHYLRAALERVVARHVASQRDYHTAKAKRLNAVNHGLDRVAEVCFVLAIVSVSFYLLLTGIAALGLIEHDLPEKASKIFTFLGVAFPTLGASLAGIRFFGDFQRFAAISRVTSEKLSAVHARIGLLLSGDDAAMTYRAASALVHEIDEIVVDEIESWQAVFGAKHIALPA